ncbi:MAG TPA: hypothetical protein VJ860_06020 [Polyangia bacterium]|nr:hypothetical protein [Polyangia bacterium]
MRANRTAITLVLAGVLASSGPTVAQGNLPASPAPSVPEAPVLSVASAPSPVSPGLDVTQPSPAGEKAGRPFVKQWWFWTALGTAVAASVVILVVADRRPSAPNTTLGNHEFQP